MNEFDLADEYGIADDVGRGRPLVVARSRLTRLARARGVSRMNTPSLWTIEDRVAIEARIKALKPDTKALWGKMDVAQTLAHCQQPLRVAIGQLRLKRGLMGVLFGGMAKRKLLADAPWSKGMPTAPEFKITGRKDFESERRALLDLVRRFGEGGPASLTPLPHPFFGPLTPEEWSTLQWRHVDHHLRQFGC